jgi:prevent-host-death family protein
MCYMDRIGLRELRQHASRYIARVARGETIEVTQRGRLVARIIPARPDTWEDMIARGDIIPAESPGGLDDIVPIDCGVNLSEVLLQMREDERY